MITSCQNCGELVNLEEDLGSSRFSCPTCGSGLNSGSSSQTTHSSSSVPSPALDTQIRKSLWAAFWLSAFGWRIMMKAETGVVFIGLLLFLIGIGFEWRMFYLVWKNTSDPGSAIGPVKAFGFSLIPIFNLYWVFHAYPSFVRRTAGTKWSWVGILFAIPFCLNELSVALTFSADANSNAASDVISILWHLLRFLAFYWVLTTALSKRARSQKTLETDLPTPT